MTPDDKTELKLNIGKIPQLLLDNTDRNRTSPIAFTGNKFEYRAVGSSANCAQPMIALNTIVAKQLREFKQDVDKRIEDGMGKDEAILKELQKLIKASKAIRFEGNGYSEEWKNEAEKRGLKNLKDTPAALEIWEDEKVIQLFEEMKIFSKRELVARQDIEYEKYIKQIQIEARILSELILSNLIPAVITYQNTLIQNIKGLEEVFGKEDTSLVSVQKKLLTKIAKRLDTLQKLSAQMQENRKEANKIKDNKEKAFAYRDKVLSFFDAIRYEIDKLEVLTDDEIWPFPKLREMMFIE
jgi:glutamine synthetase